VAGRRQAALIALESADIMRFRINWSAALLLLAAVQGAHAQPAWRPDKPVEIIVPTGASGINDANARLLQKAMQELKLVPTPVLVNNKPGGNQSLAVVYLNQHPADAHYLLYATATIFTNQIAGVTQLHYTDFTPLALLLVEYSVITVAANSPMKSMRDMVERLRADPESVAFGVVARGGPNHLAAAQAMRTAGIDPKRLKMVVFKTNAESLIAVIGGHIQAVVSSVSAALPQVQAGNARMLGVTAPQRVGGSIANVPTMREQGIDALGIANWRGVFGAKGITPAQIAYWEDVIGRTTTTDDWKKQLDTNNLVSRFMRNREFAKYLEMEYGATRATMADAGLIK
jgi:putative tricarboxylic transport membrane protein